MGDLPPSEYDMADTTKLDPARWMTDLVASDPEVYGAWPVTKFIYPGSHDACTWGNGKVSFNWHCQDLTLLEQLSQAGQRFFDVRLKPAGRGAFVPFHGLASNTADGTTWSGTSGEGAPAGSLIDQILTFANDQPGEIIILFMTFSTLSWQTRESWTADTWAALGPRLLKPTTSSGSRPTYADATSTKRTIILAARAQAIFPNHPLQDYIWDTEPGSTTHFLGTNAPELYNGATWQSKQPRRVLRSITSWVTKNEEAIQRRRHFWIAQVQLTPTGNPWHWFGGGIDPKKRLLLCPRDLALGGTDTDGSPWAGSNWYVKQEGIFSDAFWVRNASVVWFDFAGCRVDGANGKEGEGWFFSEGVVRMNEERRRMEG